MGRRDQKVITGMWACARPMGKYKWIWPGTILSRIDKLLRFEDKKILQMFSGISEIGDTIDINSTVNPKWVWDLTKPIQFLETNSYDIILADPPYTDFKPYCFINEAVRLLKPRGFLVILHFLVYKTPKGCRRWAVICVTSGPNMRVRALNIFQKVENGQKN